MIKTILVTGGCGFIGSHTIIELLNNNYNVIIVDNLINSNHDVIDKISKITNKKVIFYKEDIGNYNSLKSIFSLHNINAVIHFAALKAVGESNVKPLEYYENNVSSSIVLFKIMNEFNVKNIVFSSSATVYGNPKSVPIKENFSLNPTNPYGRTKLMVEEIIKDVAMANQWNYSILRYFNPVGAHKSGLIGELPKGIPNNLMPYINNVAIGKSPFLRVFGCDYNTPDGTGVRDYIHVVDLALGHIKALEYIFQNKNIVVNLGTGRGYSVLEIIKAYEKVINRKIDFKYAERRAGDIASSYADTSLAIELLNWKSKYNLDDMCQDSWNFIKQYYDK